MENLSNNDIKNILIDYKNSISLDDIKIKYKKSKNSIKTILLNICYDLIHIYDFDIELVSNKINVSISDINNFIDFKLNNKNEILLNKEQENKEQENEILFNNNNKILLNKEQEDGFNNFVNRKNIFITGPGGTGKSILIKEIIKYCNDNNFNFGVTATTGSAALLIGGRTIHSYLGIGIGNKSPSELFKNNRYILPHIIKKIRQLDVLIIDEISLMDINLFELISCYLSLVKSKSITEPFGNIQIILSGDFCQLEPVNGEYCFLSDIWEKLKLKTIFLNKMIRQEHDKTFQKILKSLRYGICDDNILNILKQCNRPLEFNDIKPTILYSKNIDVDKINKIEYDKLILTNKSHTYNIILPDKKKDHNKILNWIKTLDTPLSVDICINAQVIITTNINQDLGIINGTRGIITQLNANYVVIKTINNELINITYYKNIYQEDNSLYFSYMPIKLAYALSIHKSQGATLDAIEINIGKDIFAAGQAYTALSRARSLNNVIIKDVIINSFIIKDKVLEFYSKIDKKLKI